MPRPQRYQTPLHQPRFNNTPEGQFAQGVNNSIAALILGGQSPNDAAESASEAALREKQGMSAEASAEKNRIEADIARLFFGDASDPAGYAKRRTASMEGLTPEQQPFAATAWQTRANRNDPANIAKAENLNRDVASLLMDPSQAGEVGTRNAAVEGKSLYGTGGEGQILQHFTGGVQQTPVSRANIAKTGAETRKADAEAKTGTDGAKPQFGWRYKPDGSLEAIPGGPADEKSKIRTQGGDTVDTLVTTLNDYYDQLDEGGGITNPKEGTLSNVRAGLSSSAAGQAAGRMFGTQNQSTRNKIAQARPLLLQAIKNATGMSAKQMDSNVELKLYLSAATDPTLDVSANREALANIVKLYGSANPADTPATPAAGKLTVYDSSGNAVGYVSKANVGKLPPGHTAR